jgi:hypothetical protein
VFAEDVGVPGTVLVVGGYGAVGSAVVRQLAGWVPGRVVAAGRDVNRARRLAVDVGGEAGVRAARVDVTDLDGVARVLMDEGIAVVVLCVGPPDEALARMCLARGVHVVDVGASPDLLARIEALDAGEATVVLGVGLAPGLTNLLARQAHEQVGGAERLDITVLVGTGEHHGLDALRWTLSGLAAPPRGARPRRVPLPGYGTRTAHPFPFSDQHTLRSTLGVPEVTTRLCLDSRALGAAVFGLRRLGALRLARQPAVQRFLAAALHRVPLAGGDGFAVRVDAVSADGRHVALAVTGRNQSRITGLVAADVGWELLVGGLPRGVHHIEQLDRLRALPARLGGVVTWWTVAAPA